MGLRSLIFTGVRKLVGRGGSEVREPKAFNLSGLRCLLNVKVELSGRHLAMNPEFRRKSGHTYKYLVLRPNEREEVYYLDTGMFQNLEIRKTRRNKQRGLQPIK